MALKRGAFNFLVPPPPPPPALKIKNRDIDGAAGSRRDATVSLSQKMYMELLRRLCICGWVSARFDYLLKSSLRGVSQWWQEKPSREGGTGVREPPHPRVYGIEKQNATSIFDDAIVLRR